MRSSVVSRTTVSPFLRAGRPAAAREAPGRRVAAREAPGRRVADFLVDPTPQSPRLSRRANLSSRLAARQEEDQEEDSAALLAETLVTMVRRAGREFVNQRCEFIRVSNGHSFAPPQGVMPAPSGAAIDSFLK